MHTRIVELLTQITDDEFTGKIVASLSFLSLHSFVISSVDLLRQNDELNHSFKTFENYMQERERRCSTRTKAVKDCSCAFGLSARRC